MTLDVSIFQYKNHSTSALYAIQKAKRKCSVRQNIFKAYQINNKFIKIIIISPFKILFNIIFCKTKT